MNISESKINEIEKMYEVVDYAEIFTIFIQILYSYDFICKSYDFFMEENERDELNGRPHRHVSKSTNNHF